MGSPVLALYGRQQLFWRIAGAPVGEAPDLRPWSWWPVGLVLVVAGLVGCFLESRPLGIVLTLSSFVFALLAVGQTLASWRADLVEGRRRLRLFIVGASSLYIVLTAAAQLAGSARPVPAEASLTGAIGLLIIATAVAWALLRVATSRRDPLNSCAIPKSAGRLQGSASKDFAQREKDFLASQVANVFVPSMIHHASFPAGMSMGIRSDDAFRPAAASNPTPAQPRVSPSSAVPCLTPHATWGRRPRNSIARPAIAGFAKMACLLDLSTWARPVHRVACTALRREADTPAPALLPPIAGPALVEPSNPAIKAALDRTFAEISGPPYRNTHAVVIVHDGWSSPRAGRRASRPWPASRPAPSATRWPQPSASRNCSWPFRSPIDVWCAMRDPRHAICSTISCA